jgi:hypothetical protein
MKAKILSFTAILITGSLLVAAVHPDLRAKARLAIKPQERVILAVTKAYLDSSSDEFQILKVKTNDGLFVEVYGMDDKNGSLGQILLSSIKLADKKDGYFTFNGQVTNLAIDDINNDERKEILVTSFDENLVAHLSAFQFKRGQKTLEQVSLN